MKQSLAAVCYHMHLISALQELHRPCSAPLWVDRVSKKQFVKADLAIYSQMLGVSGEWVSIAMKSRNFMFCVIWSGFQLANPVTIGNVIKKHKSIVGFTFTSGNLVE